MRQSRSGSPFDLPEATWQVYERTLGKGSKVVCEGAKAADAALTLGRIATTSVDRSNIASKTNWLPIAGMNVVVLPDNDKAGENYAKSVTTWLHAAQACSVRIGRLKYLEYELPIGGDLADLIGTRIDHETLRNQIDTFLI